MTNQITNNNTRIAKNTLMLYFRMFFTMSVSLYTSRVVLNALGVEDYGIYSVVGGVIALFTFINTAMVSSTQRYINVELANGDKNKLRSVFNTSLQIHALVSLIIVILGETVGMWFLLSKLVIPESRMIAAMWVYQCSIILCVVNIMSAPYNADIIAHERMSAFAYISILEVSLKLFIVYLLILMPYDKLIVYVILLLLIQLLIRFIYAWYCNKNFKESFFKIGFDKALFKDMARFAGWSLCGNLAGVLCTQGLNILLNIFFGPVVNAARGIAVQVQAAIWQFMSGFQTALNPQITQNYAKGNIIQMHNLMFRSARFSFLLLLFVSLPVLLETKFVLALWLKNVPENTVVFTQIMIGISLLYATVNPLVIANQATGKIKNYQIVVGGTLLAILPISYIVLKTGAPAYSVFIVHLSVEAIAQFFRMLILRKQINLNMLDFLKNIYIPLLATVMFAIIIPIFVHNHFTYGWLRFFTVSITCVFSVSISSFMVGLTRHERKVLLDKGLRIVYIRKFTK